MATVLLVRHGRTSANTAGVLAGRSPGVELDDEGRRQAATLGERLAPVPLAGVVTSPLRRCRQTAQALLGARTDGILSSTDAGLIECGYGEWTGRTLKELSKEKLWKTVQQQPSAVRFPGGEAMTEMAARAVGTVRTWDAKLTTSHGEDAIWVAVSHGDVIKAILADALGTHLDTFQRILVNPASVSVVRYTATRPYVVTMNSSGGDLAALFPPRKPAGKRARRPRSSSDDAPVGGGLGAAEVTPRPAD
ncbi:MAG TPA: histidine phosphatase family protein [Microlunatus sp.]|nr:histidine phosphatase family protein [Microlunatus sp.]